MPVRANESAGIPAGRIRETPTVTFVPAGAPLDARVMVSAKPPTFGSAMGAPTLEAGMEVDADCGVTLGCWIGEKVGTPVPELQP
jgi:hypothetical protein